MSRQIIGEVLGHALGQRRDEHPFLLRRPRADLPDEIVDLVLHRADLHRGSTRPVGRMTCSTMTPPDFSNS